jgi:TRAP-type uncharacterized transport system fused permease subunit
VRIGGGVTGIAVTGSGVTGIVVTGSGVIGSVVTGSRVIKPIKRIPVKKFNLMAKHR